MNNKITFAELIDVIADDADLKRDQIRELLLELSAVAQEGVKTDGRVYIPGLGYFGERWRGVRSGVNPQNGDEIEIPAHYQIVYKADAGLRRFINRRYAHLQPQVLDEKEKPAVSQPDGTAIPAAHAEPEKTTKTPVPERKPTPPSRAAPRSEKKVRKRSTLVWWLLLIFILLLIFWVADKCVFTDSPSEIDAGKPIDLSQTAVVPAEEPAPAVVEAETVQIEEPAVVEEEIVIEEPEAVPEETFKIREIPRTPGGLHTIMKGDKLWTIAEFFYNDPYLWPNIFRINLEALPDPDRLIVEDVIEIPPLEGIAGDLTRRDLMDISEGYLLVYVNYRDNGKRDYTYYLWVADQYLELDADNPHWDKINAEDLKAVEKLKGIIQIK